MCLTLLRGRKLLNPDTNSIIMRVWHRSQTSCTAEEAWTKFVVLNKNGTANELEASSRNFNPANIFHDMKCAFLTRMVAPS